MTEIIGGVLMVAGGGMLTLSSLAQLRAGRSAVDRARHLLGDSDPAVFRALPTDLTLLVLQLD